MKKTIRQVVVQTLEKSKVARANDNELIYQVLKKLGYPTDYAKLRNETKNIVSTITRERNLAMKRNPLMQPSKQVSKRRLALEKHARKVYGGF